MININELTSQLTEIVEYTQGKKADCSNIVTKWYAAKKYFIDLLGGELIYTCPETITFELDNHTKAEKMVNFMSDIAIATSSDYNNKIVDFLQDLSLEEFYNNLTEQEYCYGDLIIPKKYKVIKAFKYFFHDKESLERFQTEASQIIQDNCVTGKLCFSVHPLDFISASENTHNWRSCFALDGEYRSSSFNYMVDKSTVICYLRPDNEVKLPHFPESIPWNSKKWRVWLHFSNDKSMIFASRQYPFNATAAEQTIQEKLLNNIFRYGSWSTFYKESLRNFHNETTDTSFRIYRGIPVGNSILSVKDFVFNGWRSVAYNDILRNPKYENPVFSYRNLTYNNKIGDTTTKNTKFSIGEECPCPICGRNFIAYHSVIACVDCAYKYGLLDDDCYVTCNICGLQLDVDCDEEYCCGISGDSICGNCYDTQLNECQNCGVKDTEWYIHERPETGLCLCDDCAKRGIM